MWGIIMTKREKEIIYFALSRLLDNNNLSQDEFNEIDDIRDEFYVGDGMPTY